MFNKIKYKIGVVVLDTEIPYVDEWGQHLFILMHK